MASHQTHKSKERIRHHGEVFTNEREVKDMLDLVRQETERIESRFLEPACGTGNFLKEVLRRKLAIVEKRYSKNQLEFERYAVLAASSIYGIDLLKDNVVECRMELLDIFTGVYRNLYKKKSKPECEDTVSFIISRNILWGDALSLKTPDEKAEPIVFSEWSTVNGSLMKRRDFTLANMLESSPPPETGGQTGMFTYDNLRPTAIVEYPVVHFLKIGAPA